MKKILFCAATLKVFSLRKFLQLVLPSLCVLSLIENSVRSDLVLTVPFTPVTVNFNSFTGTGFATSPTVGQLSSNTWRVTGMSDGAGTFGGTHTAVDFARGTSNGGATTGGVYAFQHATGNYMLGFQPGGSDFTPGTLTARLLNNTGATITGLAISYDIIVRNDQDRSSSFNFAHSGTDSAYTSVPSLNYTTAVAADVSPAWETVQRQTNLAGLNIANGANYYLQWQSADVGGSGSRDEFGLDNLSVTAIPEPASAGLIALGLVGLSLVLRRK